MSTANYTACTSPITLQRITNARMTPHVADTWRNWAQAALIGADACASRRAGDCDACKALQKISAMAWSEALGAGMLLMARDALGRLVSPRFIKRETVCASY